MDHSVDRPPCKIHTREETSAMKNCGGRSDRGRGKLMRGSGRYPAKVEIVRGRQRMARRNSLSFSRFRGRLVYTRRHRFRVDLFLPSLVFRTTAYSYAYVFTRALFVLSSSRFLCFNSSTGMFTEVDMSNSVIQHYLSIVLRCTF